MTDIRLSQPDLIPPHTRTGDDVRQRSSSPEMVELHDAVKRAAAVLFDFDFTLADSSEGIVTCINYALSQMGLRESPTGDIIKTVGLYLPEALVELKGEAYRPRGDEFMRHFTRRADEVMMDGTFLLPGAEYVLRSLSRLGYRLAIVSTKYRYRIESILDRDGLRDTVEIVVGGEDVGRHKPDPEGLVIASERLGVPLDGCVYIGDSQVDARAAEAVGMSFIALMSGATTRDVFDTCPNEAVLPGVAHLARPNPGRE